MLFISASFKVFSFIFSFNHLDSMCLCVVLCLPFLGSLSKLLALSCLAHVFPQIVCFQVFFFFFLLYVCMYIYIYIFFFFMYSLPLLFPGLKHHRCYTVGIALDIIETFLSSAFVFCHLQSGVKPTRWNVHTRLHFFIFECLFSSVFSPMHSIPFRFPIGIQLFL